MVSQYEKSAAWAATFSFILVFSLWSLELISVQLENPFGLDSNDIDGMSMQLDFNTHLRLLIRPETLRIPHLSPEQISEACTNSALEIACCPSSAEQSSRQSSSLAVDSLSSLRTVERLLQPSKDSTLSLNQLWGITVDHHHIAKRSCRQVRTTISQEARTETRRGSDSSMATLASNASMATLASNMSPKPPELPPPNLLSSSNGGGPVVKENQPGDNESHRSSCFSEDDLKIEITTSMKAVGTRILGATSCDVSGSRSTQTFQSRRSDDWHNQ
jgi:hypothetical protein